MAHYPAEDHRRLHEGRWDTRAWTEASQLTDIAALHEALLYLYTGYASATQRLEAAAASSLRERRESDAARATLEGARQRLAAAWRFVRSKAQDALFNTDPDDPPLVELEMTRRQRLFAQTFPLTFSELAVAPPNDALTHAQAAVTALQDGAELEALNLHERIARAAADLNAAHTEWMREAREDRAATEHVWQARADFDKAQAAYADVLRAALRLQGRLPELGRWLRAEDAAYKSRRQARAPIEEEPAAPPESPEPGEA